MYKMAINWWFYVFLWYEKIDNNHKLKYNERQQTIIWKCKQLYTRISKQ
jgi:hypothetical protein